MKGLDGLVRKNLSSMAQDFLDAAPVVADMESSYKKLFRSAQQSFVQIPVVYDDVRQCISLLFDVCDPDKHVQKSPHAINTPGLKLVRQIVLDCILGDDRLLGQKGSAFMKDFRPLLEKCYPSEKWRTAHTDRLKDLMERVEKEAEETHEYFLQLRTALSHREVDLLFLQSRDVWLEGGAEFLKKLFKLRNQLKGVGR